MENHLDKKNDELKVKIARAEKLTLTSEKWLLDGPHKPKLTSELPVTSSVPVCSFFSSTGIATKRVNHLCERSSIRAPLSSTRQTTHRGMKRCAGAHRVNGPSDWKEKCLLYFTSFCVSFSFSVISYQLIGVGLSKAKLARTDIPRPNMVEKTLHQMWYFNSFNKLGWNIFMCLKYLKPAFCPDVFLECSVAVLRYSDCSGYYLLQILV